MFDLTGKTCFSFFFRGIPLTTTALLINMSVIQYISLLRIFTYLKVMSLSLTFCSRERVNFSFNPLKRSGYFRYHQVEHENIQRRVHFCLLYGYEIKHQLLPMQN
jgi:hypothetical protein